MPKMNPLLQIAKMSPGTATAAAQVGLSESDKQQIAAFAELKQTHQFLTTLDQNDAYKSYSKLTPDYQDALKTFFSPKYVEKERNIVSNVLNSLKSSVVYTGLSFKELGMQVAGIPFTPETNADPLKSLYGLALAGPKAVSESTGITKGVGEKLETLMRPAEKLIKQPYTAQRLAEEEGQGDYLSYGKFLLEGAKELLPGGQDAAVDDNSQTWKKYWEQASDKENVFDKSETDKLESTLDPSVVLVGKLLAGKKNLLDNYDKIIQTPGALELVNRYTSGLPEDEEARLLVGDAVARFEKSKISPGRDVARALVSAFPFEYEKALLGDGPAKIFFNTISGGLDGTVTFGLDPLILVGKAKRATDIARFGLIKMGENPNNLQKAWKNRSVRKYWDKAGKLLETYSKADNAGDLKTAGKTLTILRTRFPELSQDVIMYMAPNIKDADTALEFFRNGDIVADMYAGNAGLRRSPLIPRYTQTRAMQDSIRNMAAKVLKTDKYSTIDLPDTIDDFARLADENPVGWSERLGYTEVADAGAFAGKRDGKRYVSKDASTAARIDRAIVRPLSIAPGGQRMIALDDASGADQIFRLVRTVLDKGNASTWRQAWIKANEGERLLMYKGMLKTLAVGMGFDLTANGRKFLDEIDNMTAELYSVNQSAIDLGEFSRILGTTSAKGLPVPSGVRLKVAEITDKTTAAGKATRLAAATNAEMGDIIANIADLKKIKKQLIERAKTPASAEEVATIGELVGDIDKSLRILGGTLGKMKVAKKEVVNIIDGLSPVDTEVYNAAEMNGAQYAVRAYQFNNKRYMPNLMDLRQFELRGNIFSSITGRVGESVTNQQITDIWSFMNLYPRLGVRTVVEEVGTSWLIGGIEGIGNYFKGFAISQERRKITEPTIGTKIRKKDGELVQKELSPLGLLSRNFYKLTRKNYTKDEIAAARNNPELTGKIVAESLLKSRFKPDFLKTEQGKRNAGYAEDFIRNDGQVVIDEINSAVRNSEIKIDSAEETAAYLNQYGPSVALNTSLTEALKDQKFRSVFSQIEYNNPGFLINWYLDLQNTIGRKNIFGQIVFTNIAKKEEDVIEVLVKYLDGKGANLAKRSAIANAEGNYAFAKRIYADATSTLRDFSGKLNKNLIEEIKASGGIDNFEFQQLGSYYSDFTKRPKSVLGRELIPVEVGDVGSTVQRIMNNGYGWIGKQIAMLDREPIMYGNYLMYRKDLVKYEDNFKNSIMSAGVDEETAILLAKDNAHATAMGLARQRTIGYIDNSDVRTNLAFNVRNFGRYYRATEDFWRRAARVGKYEKRAIVRLAILNQTFEHSGFVHEDANGEKYFTYPGDDVLNYILGNTVFRALGLPGAQPLAVNLGGKLKMTTPSLDPESAAPGLSGPFIGLAFTILENLPVIGDFLKKVEPTVTGGIPNQEWWRKIAPINLQRLLDLGSAGNQTIMTEQKYSAAVQGMKLLVSVGQGPKTGADINPFMTNSLIQAMNVMTIRFFTGLGAPASVQLFATKDVPQEMIDAGMFTWDSEFAREAAKFVGDPDGFSKALVRFARLYPSKTVWATSKTTSATEASFQKTYEAAQFVQDNKDLVLNHKQAAAFFIPITGTGDLESYSYLKSSGFVKNKDLEDFLREASVAGVRQKYNERRDYYDAAVLATNSIQRKKELRDGWKGEQLFFKSTYPLLRKQLEPEGFAASKIEALDDLRNVVTSKMAPNKELNELFGAMIYIFDTEYTDAIAANPGSASAAEQRRKFIREDVKEKLREAAGDNPNGRSLYWNIFEPLIGD